MASERHEWNPGGDDISPNRCSATWYVLLIVLFLGTHCPLSAQDDQPIIPEFTSSRGERLLTLPSAQLQVSRLNVSLEVTNAYQPDGIRFLAIQLGFQNTGTTEITVIPQASQLLVGHEEILRLQSNAELLGHPFHAPGEKERTFEGLQGEGTVAVPANGKTVTAWLFFAKLPRTRDLPPMTLQLMTSTGQVDLELTRIENEGLTAQLERIGPSGRVGIARISGELNAINTPYFSKMITGFAEQGVSRLVVSFDPRSRIGDELTEEWLVNGREEDNELLQFYPDWSGLIRDVVYANLPDRADETGDSLSHSEADAVQRVTRDLMPGLDRATLHREIRTGHPLIRRAILLNAGDAIANDNMEIVLEFLNSTDPNFSDSLIRQAAIQSLRAAVVPQAVTILEGIVRQGSPEDAVLALKSLNESQQAAARDLAIRLAEDPVIQTHLCLVKILRTVGVTHDERWLPLLQASFQNPDPGVRDIALEQLLRTEPEDRLDLLRTALADTHEPIRERAFLALATQCSTDEHPLFIREALNRVTSGRKDERTLLALREIRDPSVLPQLLKWIHEQPEDDLSLVTTYVEIGGTEVLGNLVENFPNFSLDTRSFLLKAFLNARHPESRRLVSEGLLSDAPNLHTWCQEALVERGDDEAVAILSEAIEKSSATDTSRNQELARGLGSIGSPSALLALEKLKTNTHIEKQKLADIGINSSQMRSPIIYWLQAANQKTSVDDFEGAIQILNLALEIEPESSRVHNSLGFAQMGLARGAEAEAKDNIISQAKAHFEKALTLSPNDHNPLTGIAICKAYEGRYEEAVRMVDTPQLRIRFSDQKIYLYNVACVYGVSLEQLLKETETPERSEKVRRYQQQAMLFLNAAIEQGFDEIKLLTIDPDLNTLRDLPSFKKLSAKIMEQNQ